ncbi:MAG: DUF4340 domain-containing protein [bacterium]|nr:DUF4340 domain-containing protein [bacterium]
MSRFRSTFLIVVVFVALFSYFWIYQKDKVPPEPVSDIPAPETYQLANYSADDLTEISWKSASYSATIQNPGEQKWKLVTPALPADEKKIKAYADSLLSLTGNRKLSTKDISLNDAGLSAPLLTISIKKKDNSTDVYKVGSKTIDGDYYYVAKDGSDVITLLGSYVIDDLNKDPATLRVEPSSSPAAAGSPGTGVPLGSTTPQS